MKDNPYQAPESDLTVNQVEMPKTTWWKVFFFINILIMPLAVFGFALSGDFKLSIVEYIDLLISFVFIVGLFGLAFNKALGTQAFWKYFFYVLLVDSIIINLIFPVAGIESYGQKGTIDIYFFIGNLFTGLVLWASYLYGFKRPQIWNRT